MVTKKGKAFIQEWFGEGHSILKEEAVPFADLGLDKTDRDLLVMDFMSDTSDPKSTIFKDGKVVDKVRGVNSLMLWAAVAGRLGVESGHKAFFGRGTQARVLCEAILKKIG